MIEFFQPEFSHVDDRGALHQLISKGWNQVNVIFSKAGTVRGDHWHEMNREMFYCISGSFTLHLEKDDQKSSNEIRAGQLFVIGPYVRHTFDYHEDTTLVTLYDRGVVMEGGVMDIKT